MSRARRLAQVWVWALLCALGLVLSACGGGGASANNTPSHTTPDTGGEDDDDETPIVRDATAVSEGAATLAGVVAIGTPVLDAELRVYDALGVFQGTADTNPVDGSYSLPLTTASRTLPLFVQAVGTDHEGSPVVLHTVVQDLSTGGASNAVQINPLTDAVVAMLLGGNPADFFANPAAYANWRPLADRVGLRVATTFLRTVLGANFRDAGFADGAAANFFNDSSFRANKTGIDAVLESVRIAFGTGGDGHPTLLLSNRLAATGSTEVTLDLSMLTASLAATPSVANANAILSTMKATSGNAGIMTSVAGLNTLTGTINVAMARHYDLLAMSQEPIFHADYSYNQGRSLIDSIVELVDHGLADRQFSDFQILSCLDEVVSADGCTRIAVAAQIRKADGTVFGVYRNAVSYSAQDGWRLRGNGEFTPWAIYPVAWHTWDGSGNPYGAAPDPGEAANAGTGIQVVILAPEFMLGTVQLPNNTAVDFHHCNTANFTPMCLELTETGDLLRDQVLRMAFGSIDTTAGALYRLRTETVGHIVENKTTALKANLPQIASASVFPLPDGIATVPVSQSDVVNGLTVSWNDWAAANPELSVVEVFTVGRSVNAFVKTSKTVQSSTARQVTLDALPGLADAYHFTLWMVAQDASGRRYISKIITQP